MFVNCFLLIFLSVQSLSLTNPILSPPCTTVQSKNAKRAPFILEIEDEFILTSPGYPLNYPEAALDCYWQFKLGARSQGTGLNLQCDAFDVGAAQPNGKCYGDALWLQSAHNDTIELCGKRDGLALRLSGYQGILSVVFKSLSKSTKRGFSCRLKADQDQGIQEELETAVESTDGEEAQGFVDSSCECGKDNGEESSEESIANRIIRGREAKPNEYPWQVALVKSGGHSPFCGGSIISDKHILTAAHCTSDQLYSRDVEVLVGEHDLMTVKDECQRHQISRIFEHPNYNENTVAFDFSIIVLAEKLHFSAFVRPVCMPVLSYPMSNSDFRGAEVSVSGWGLHTFSPVTNGHGPYAQRLNKLSGLTVVTNDDCQRKWNDQSDTYGFISVVNSMICAMPPSNSSACFGDSGGPLMLKTTSKGGRYVLVGVVSFGPQGCVSATLPNVYARVTDVLPWIFSIVKSANTCLPIENELQAKLRHF